MSEHNSLESSSLLKASAQEHPLAKALDEAMDWSMDHKTEVLLSGSALCLAGALVSGRALASSLFRKEGSSLAKESALDFGLNPLEGLLNKVPKPNSAATENLLKAELQHDTNGLREIQRLTQPVNEAPRALWDFEGVKQRALQHRQILAGADPQSKITFIPADKLPPEPHSLQQLLRQLDPKDLRASRNLTPVEAPASAERTEAMASLERKVYEQLQPQVVKSRVVDGVEQIKR